MRFTFLDPQAQAFYPEWAQMARSAVGALHIAAAQHPDDQQFHHPGVGDRELAYEGLELAGERDLTIVTYSAEAGTPSGNGLQLLAASAATQEATAG